ncbi:hypothetical protein [Nonomuraea typhae]|uniref:hypothetical protein n=1 Tax=Nonomuraea typhae TaxID=2603600 RepID=UPI0012FCD1B4|nr:hypothetical protein [Nonomuraea typhae]
MADVRTKALSYLRDEKVRILGANWSKPDLRPYRVSALVKGFHGLYWVRLNADGWLCSCGTRDCAHLAAVQMVTGYPSQASKPTPEMAVSA